MNNGSTSFPVQLRQSFHSNPVGRRVWLPDGSLAVVKAFHDDHGERFHRVVGITEGGRFCKLPPRVPHWYLASELKLVYYSVRALEVAA